eukprot:1508649-Pyramimonas_sp.AAC.1
MHSTPQRPFLRSVVSRNTDPCWSAPHTQAKLAAARAREAAPSLPGTKPGEKKAKGKKAKGGNRGWGGLPEAALCVGRR